MQHAFADLDWDFPEETTEEHVTGLHPFPARFIPAIPRAAVHTLLKKQGVVWDPFAGSGTTLIEAMAAGHRAVGIDVNHLAHFLQRVFTARLSGPDVESLHLLALLLPGLRAFPDAASVLRKRGSIPRLDHWFSPGACQAIEAYLSTLQTSALSATADLVARFGLSRVLVRISRQQSDTQYRATKPDLPPGRAMEVIHRSLTEVLEALPRHQGYLGERDCTLRLGDAREPETYHGLPSPDLIVTSPPYPNAYEYWLYHKYRMFWLDMDPIWSRSREIGARPFYSGTGKLGPLDFRRDMAQVLSNITAHSKETTRQVWVVGDGVVKGKKVPTAEIVVEEASRLGWSLSWQGERSLLRSRSSFQGIGRMKHEQILVLERRS